MESLWRKRQVQSETVYWSHGEFDAHGEYLVTMTEDRIIEEYWCHWMERMREIGKTDQINKENCIDDWKIGHWSFRSDKDGNPI